MEQFKAMLERMAYIVLKEDVIEQVTSKNVVIPVIVCLLIIWLMYRIKNNIKGLVIKELDRHFPYLKRHIDDLEHRINSLNSRAQALDNTFKEYEDRLAKE